LDPLVTRGYEASIERLRSWYESRKDAATRNDQD